MKKLLALVLALVMTLSLAVVSSNAAFKDADKVNETYAEAVEVLNGMKVFKGYEDGSFNPEGAITRAEVAAIVYRLYTGDVKDAQASLYATYNKFNDMSGAKWAAGYIGYCANAGLIKGYNDTTFGPSDKVTGYQALAMILRAVGYDKNGEFTGAGWQLHVAQYAQQLGVLTNVKGVDLNAAASRQLVAELLFQVAAYVPMVTYTPAFGYQSVSLTGGNAMFAANATLGYKNFGLTCDKTYGSDAWGRPAYVWYGEYNNAKNYQEKSKDVLYATISEKAAQTYYTAQTECQIATDLGLKKNTPYSVYVNGMLLQGTFTVEPLDTKNAIGAQGRLMEIYSDRIVMIDTHLAKVENVKAAAYDKNGHLRTEATMTLTVYDDSVTVQGQVKGETPVVLTNGETNYEYAKGDMLLINAFTTRNTVKVSGAVINGEAQYVEIVGKATSVEGNQTVVWGNTAKHTVNGTTYDDAAEFNHDEATGYSTKNYTWYFDQYNNLIGSFLIETQYSYAVLKNIAYVTNGLEGGYATGTLVYMDGSENVVKIDAIEGKPVAYSYNNIFFGPSNNYFYVTMDPAVNAKEDKTDDYIDGHLYQVFTNAKGNVELTKVLKADGKTHAEISAKVYNKATAIGSNLGIGGIYVDDATTFLVGTPNAKGVYSYKSYNGVQEVPTFSKNDVKIDYVLVNGVAKYVYIIGTPDAAETKDLVLITSQGFNYTLADEIYEVNLYTAEGFVTVKTADVNVVKTLISSDAVNKLFYISYSNGLATAAVPVTGDAMAVSADGKTFAKLLDNKGLSYAKNVLNWYGYPWYTNGATIVGSYTELTDGMDFSDARVYVVYTVGAQGENRVASKVYVIDLETSGGGNSGNPTDPTAAVWTKQGNYEYTVISGAQPNMIGNIYTAVQFETLGSAATTFSGTMYVTAPGELMHQATAAELSTSILQMIGAGYKVQMQNAFGAWTFVASK